MQSTAHYYKRIKDLVVHVGFKYKCPFCSYRASKFMWAGSEVERELGIIGGGKRRTLCPKCYSLDRERLIYLFLSQSLQIQKSIPDLRVLHVAPENQLFKKLKKLNFAQYVCGDYFQPGYSYPEGTINLDITDAQFPDESFDLILCNHVLEHIPDATLALSELFRILSPKGQAILQVPISSKNPATLEDFSITDANERLIKFGQWDHVRLFGFEDYPKLLSKAGFEVQLIPANPEFVSFGIDTNEVIYLVKKPNSLSKSHA